MNKAVHETVPGVVGERPHHLVSSRENARSKQALKGKAAAAGNRDGTAALKPHHCHSVRSTPVCACAKAAAHVCKANRQPYGAVQLQADVVHLGCWSSAAYTHCQTRPAGLGRGRHPPPPDSRCPAACSSTGAVGWNKQQGGRAAAVYDDGS